MSLYLYQQQAKEHLQQWKVGALFMEAGTGKTRVSCELINSVPELDLVVWFAPLRTIKSPAGVASVIDEVNKWSDFKCNTLFVGIESIGSSDRKYLEVLQQIKEARKPFVIVDESIKIKNMTAKRTRRLLEISKYAEYKLILNGTPLSKNLLDLWAQMEFLSPAILQMDLTKFKNTFCKYTEVTKTINNRFQYKKEFITGYENIDYLYSLIRHYIYECDLKLQVRQIYNTVRYTVDKSSLETYKNIKDMFLNDEMLMYKNNNIFLEMTQKMQHSCCCSEDKVTKLRQLFNDIDESKTIIFCNFILSQELCRREFPRALALSYHQSAFGLNLQDYRNTIYFDKNWDYAVREQSNHRTYRVGQTADCRYWDLDGNIGLDNLFNKCIEKKINMVEYFKTLPIKTLKEKL